MPKYPHTADTARNLVASVYSSLAERVRAHKGETFPFHVGDTWLKPATGCRMEDLQSSEYPSLHRYSSPLGLPELRQAVAERVTERSGCRTTSDNVLITAGATGGLSTIAGALLNPGDEVLILAPYWPLISGIVSSFRGYPVPVPCLGSVQSAAEAVQALEEKLTSRSVALYLNTPYNPTGLALPPDWLRALISWAERKGLWVLADEVYEDYQYVGKHTYSRPLAPERTLSIHSFSKAYGMAGNRCGYLVGPAETLADLIKISTHSFYSAPTASQIAALRALSPAGDRWLQETHRNYFRIGTQVAAELGVNAPEGSTFLFLDVSKKLDGRGLEGFLEACADRGLLLAPGPSFGPYPKHLRLCFTAIAPEKTLRGVKILAEILGG